MLFSHVKKILRTQLWYLNLASVFFGYGLILFFTTFVTLISTLASCERSSLPTYSTTPDPLRDTARRSEEGGQGVSVTSMAWYPSADNVDAKTKYFCRVGCPGTIYSSTHSQTKALHFPVRAGSILVDDI